MKSDRFEKNLCLVRKWITAIQQICPSAEREDFERILEILNDGELAQGEHESTDFSEKMRGRHEQRGVMIVNPQKVPGFAHFRRRKPRVVIAEDDPWFREWLVKTVVQAGGIVISVAQNGEEARLFCCKLRPDWLLTDYSMPKLNGLQLIQNLGEEPFNVNTIAISHQSDRALRSEFAAAGVSYFFCKDDLKGNELLEFLEEQWKGE